MDENKTAVETENEEKKETIFNRIGNGFKRVVRFGKDHIGDAAKVLAGAGIGFALAKATGVGDVPDDYYCTVEDDATTDEASVIDSDGTDE